MNKSSAKIAVVSDSNKAERWFFCSFSGLFTRFLRGTPPAFPFNYGHAPPLLGHSPAKVRGVRAYCKGFPA